MKFKKILLRDISLNGKGEYGIGASAVPYNVNLPKYLRITDINLDGTLKYEDMKSVNDINSKKYILSENDIVFARTGNSTGKNYFYDISDGELVYAGFLIKFSLDPNKVVPKFIKYYCMSSYYWGWINGFSTGSTRANINAKTYGELPLILPNLSYQQKSVRILEKFDKKIKLNNQMINTLEEIASTLFKRWFVDFEFPDENGNPYKSSGGKMIDSELGEIPINWSVTSLGSEITVIDNRGKTPPIENEKTKYPIIDVKTLNSNGRVVSLDKATKFVNKETYETWFRSGHPKIGDILLSTVGSIGEMKLYLTNIGTIAQNVVGLRSNGMSPLYIYECLNHYKNDLLSYNIGSVQPSIKVTHITKYSILKPSVEILDRFNSFSKKLTEQIMNLHDQNNELSRMRDALLPKLLSGELEV